VLQITSLDFRSASQFIGLISCFQALDQIEIDHVYGGQSDLQHIWTTNTWMSALQTQSLSLRYIRLPQHNGYLPLFGNHEKLGFSQFEALTELHFPMLQPAVDRFFVLPSERASVGLISPNLQRLKLYGEFEITNSTRWFSASLMELCKELKASSSALKSVEVQFDCRDVCNLIRRKEELGENELLCLDDFEAYHWGEFDEDPIQSFVDAPNPWRPLEEFSIKLQEMGVSFINTTEPGRADHFDELKAIAVRELSLRS
jgi:hypothetical protein